MYKNLKIAVVIPAYNEEKLIGKTISTLPEFIDRIIVINDCSTDATLDRLQEIGKRSNKIHIINNQTNLGVGGSLVQGYKFFLEKTDADVVGIVAGDAQCDPKSIKPMIDELIQTKTDYVKGNRFMSQASLKLMPRFRKFGNIIISILTKFSTGYYSISDTQMGFGFLRRQILERINLSLIRYRYDYENSMLIALSIANAKIRDFPTPAIYGEEKSTINLLPTILRTLRTLWAGFWKRIYLKYILYSFHPVALFLIFGLALFIFGTVFGIYISYIRIIYGLQPSTGTVMIAVLPIIVGLQFLLTSITLDINNEPR